MPCYKRHQQRATCTGQRNETTYLKKSQVATPEGIDHDFNFLTKIERSFRTAEDKIGTKEPSSKRRKLSSNPHFNQYLSENRIILLRAPTGFNRAKSNQSRYLPRSKKVAWTVEWVDDEDQKTITEVLEDNTMNMAHTAAGVARKKQTKNNPIVHVSTSGASTNSLELPSSSTNSSPAGALSGAQASNTVDSTSLENHTETSHADGLSTNAKVGAAIDQTEQGERDTTQSTEASSSRAKTYLYLHKPRTMGSSIALIPISNYNDTLTTCLRNSLLNEFPTIYELPYAPTGLPERYILASDYEESVATTRHDVDNELSKQGLNGLYEGMAPRREQMTANGEDAWDERKILDMLKRDVSALR